MSRSYRKPYAAITGVLSAKDDKVRAARGVRRAQKFYLRKILQDDLLDRFLIPHRLECSGNEVYSWTRDGSKRLQFPVPSPGPPDGLWRTESAYRYWLKLGRK